MSRNFEHRHAPLPNPRTPSPCLRLACSPSTHISLTLLLTAKTFSDKTVSTHLLLRFFPHNYHLCLSVQWQPVSVSQPAYSQQSRACVHREHSFVPSPDRHRYPDDYWVLHHPSIPQPQADKKLAPEREMEAEARSLLSLGERERDTVELSEYLDRTICRMPWTPLFSDSPAVPY